MDRFAYVDFHIRGSLGSPVADEREAYYRVSGTPTVLFDGKNRHVGGSSHHSRYADALSAIGTESELRVTTNASYDFATGLITVVVDLEVGETIEFPEECVVRAVLAEDLFGVRSDKKVARHLALDVPLELHEEGEKRSLTAMVEPPDHWIPENMHVIAWVQRTSQDSERNAAILNGAQSALGDPTPVLRTTWGGIKATFR